ncbi:MAG: site-specific integrase [Planctomycetaceae bacterium]
MARQKTSVPRFCVDKNGRAFTKVVGRFISLGRADLPDSKLRFAKILEDHAKGLLVERAKKPADKRPGISVAELLLTYVSKELPRFSRSERDCQITTIRVLRSLFGDTPVTEFGPLRLRIVRDAMVDGDPNGKPKPRKPWSRKTVNRQIKRIQSIFRWGVSFEIVPETIATALSTLRILSVGETPAVDYAPRRAVPQSDIEAVRAQLREYHRDIFDLLLLTGARPGEIVKLRTGDIKRTGDIWRADLEKHKTAKYGKQRTLFFNGAAQAILLKHMNFVPEALIFPTRRDNFGVVIKRACKRAGVTPFVAHQLRHTVATRLADEIGAEAAQRLLGHSSAIMTETYTLAAEKQAIAAARALG